MICLQFLLKRNQFMMNKKREKMMIVNTEYIINTYNSFKMLIVILHIVTINFYMSFLNFLSTTNVLYDVIIIIISQTYRLSWDEFFPCVLLNKLVGVAWKSVIALTSSRGWSIVRVGTVMTLCCVCWFRYQIVSICIEQKYFALTTNSTEVIIFHQLLCFPVVHMTLMSIW